MKITAAQLNFTVGDIDGNGGKIIQEINKARDNGSDLVIFPELAICGYPPQDLLAYPSFTERCLRMLDQIREASSDIGVIVGCPSFNPDKGQKSLFNSAYFFENGHLIGVQHKSLLPDYDVFDEYRHFQPAQTTEIFSFRGSQLAIVICEDSWFPKGDGPYTNGPLDRIQPKQVDYLINISASPFHLKQAEWRAEKARYIAQHWDCPFVYVNQVGAHCSLIFDGGTAVYLPDGSSTTAPYFQETSLHWDIRNPSSHLQSTSPNFLTNLHEALILGIRDFFGKQGFSRAVLGLSGGIDSAITAALAVEALGPENVTGLLLPSPYSSSHSLTDAIDLANNLGIEHHTVPIAALYSEANQALAPLFAGEPTDVTEENIQARLRGMLLMAFSNKKGAILLNTTNKSEAAVGYGTLYGDLCGGLAVLADVWKTDVYRLGHYLNRDREIIPSSTLTKAPSAELRPDQKDTDSLPSYDELDPVLKLYIEECRSEAEIQRNYPSYPWVPRIISLVNRNEYKRFQSPPCLRVSHKAFGQGRAMPLVAQWK
ncbi:MAG TPA: NAD+ synthase [Luteibaculaceae bacterium]|nr:NAD+ synthase [Luteibaculaceae bacterium]